MTKPCANVETTSYTDQGRVALSATLMRLSMGADTRGFKEGFKEGWEAAKAALLDSVSEARRVWMEENETALDGRDVVTPFDYLLYRRSTMTSIQAVVVEWAARTFGPDRENAAWKKLFEEIGEVLKNPSESGEWGDVFILLYDLASMYGVEPNAAVIQKLEAMAGRTWYKTRTGTMQHDKETAP